MTQAVALCETRGDVAAATECAGAAVTIVAATPSAWMACDQLGIACTILDDLYSEHALAESKC